MEKHSLRCGKADSGNLGYATRLWPWGSQTLGPPGTARSYRGAEKRVRDLWAAYSPGLDGLRLGGSGGCLSHIERPSVGD